LRAFQDHLGLQWYMSRPVSRVLRTFLLALAFEAFEEHAQIFQYLPRSLGTNGDMQSYRKRDGGTFVNVTISGTKQLAWPPIQNARHKNTAIYRCDGGMVLSVHRLPDGERLVVEGFGPLEVSF
jgi:hypothetical protein